MQLDSGFSLFTASMLELTGGRKDSLPLNSKSGLCTSNKLLKSLMLLAKMAKLKKARTPKRRKMEKTK